MYYASSGTEQVSLSVDTFVHNHAWEGGAVFLKDSNALIDTSTFTGNNAAFGGAIALYGTPPVGVFTGPNTFTDNTAQLGGAIFAPSASKLWFLESTFTDNTADQAGGALYLDAAATTAIVNNTLTGNKAGTNGNIDVAPGFVNPGSDYHLAASSQLRDQGDDSVVNVGETDIDREPRVMGVSVDIGADEITVPYVVADAASALEIAGGLQATAPVDEVRWDWAGNPGVDLPDAIRLIRKATGLDTNP